MGNLLLRVHTLDDLNEVKRKSLTQYSPIYLLGEREISRYDYQ